jgi:tetratricopeptide (TPR) repeat protein
MGDVEANNSDWKKRESLPSALIQIILVGALLAAAVWFVVGKGNRKKEVADRLKEAKMVAIKDNPADLKKAIGMAEEILKVDPTAPEVLASLAALHTELWLVHREPGEETKAKEYLEKAEKADSKSEDRYGTKALHILATGKAKEADDFVEDLRKKGASTAKLAYAQALALKAEGNLPAERASFALATDKGWKDPQFSAAFGESLLEESQPFPALDYFNKAMANNPDHLRAKVGIALARLERKDRVADAADTIKDLLGREAELSPWLKARVYAAAAELANFEAQWDAAINASDRAVSVNADDQWALYARAKALAGKKDAGAAAAFTAVVEKAKTAPLFYFDGATLLQAAGQTDAALALLDRYEATFKGVSNTTTEGKTQGALERDDRYYLTRGDVLRDAGKLDDALAAYDKAIEAKNVNLVKATYAKGSVYLAKKDYDKAAEQLLNITPPDGTGALPEAYVAMGEIQFSKKDWAAGCQSYAYALTKLKAQAATREQLNEMLSSVEKKLITAGQAPVAKLWLNEAKPLIQ